jgi:hypothetical protein
MNRSRPTPNRPRNRQSSRPQLSLSAHEAIADVEQRTKTLLKGCGEFGSFDVRKASEILRSCAVEKFKISAEYYLGLEGYQPGWLNETAKDTRISTLGLVEYVDLSGKSRTAVEATLERTLNGCLEIQSRVGGRERDQTMTALEYKDQDDQSATRNAAGQVDLSEARFPSSRVHSTTRQRQTNSNKLDGPELPIGALDPRLYLSSEPKFPNRAAWLDKRLEERGWNKYDVRKHNGPDWKTVRKILCGLAVGEGVLEKLARALSQKPPEVKVLDIPED